MFLIRTFNSACFVAPLFGGFLADRWLGFRRAVSGGAGLLAVGFLALALIHTSTWPGFTLLLCGSGLFRSNIVAMLGRLYQAGDARRDSGYRLLYAAFNLGAVLGPPFAGFLMKAHHFWATLMLGAFAMLLALLVLQLGYRQLSCADEPVDSGENLNALDRPPADFSRWLAIGVIAQVTLVWSVSYGQIDGTLLLWARDHTRRFLLGFDVPASVFLSTPPLLVLILTPLWTFAERSTAGSTLAKILVGLGCTSLGFVLMIGAATCGDLPANALWLLGCLGLLTAGEVLIGPVSQSLIGRLAPPHHVGLMSALWYFATAIGFWWAGQFGGLWQSYSFSGFFTLLALMPILAAILLLAQRNYLRIALSR